MDDVNSQEDEEENGEDEDDRNAEENEDPDSADNTWHSEDTPEDDSFLQKKSETKSSKAKAKRDWDDDDMDDDDGDDMIHGDDLHHKTDPTDISTHGLLHMDDVNSQEDEEENGEDEDDRNAEENEDPDSADNTWHSEDTPEDDSFLQKKSEIKRVKAKQPMDDDDGDQLNHGDDLHRKDNPSDYSVHQFLNTEDKAESDDSQNEDDDDGAKEEVEDHAAEESTWHSEDTPEDDNN